MLKMNSVPSFGERMTPWSAPHPRGEHAGMEGNEPGPPALPTLEQLTEEPGSKPVAWSLRHSGLPVCALLALQRT